MMLVSQSYVNLLDIHTRRVGEFVSALDYVAIVAGPLLGLALGLAALLMWRAGQGLAVGVLMAVVAAALFVFSYLLLRHVLGARRDIESSGVLRKRLERDVALDADEMREAVLLIAELVKMGVLSR